MKRESSVKKQFDLTTKIVVITGGAGFLGRYFAEAVAEMGANVAILDLDHDRVDATVKHLIGLGYSARGWSVNLMNKANIAQTITRMIQQYKHIDILINAAAFAMNTLKSQKNSERYFAPFEDYPQELWQSSIDVNLTGTFLITQLVGKQMMKQKVGNIINIATDVAVISPDHRIYKPNKRYGYKGVSFNTPAAYSISKAGVLALTRYLATYWADFGIRVNAISPAGVYKNQEKKFIEQLVQRIPLGRMAYPEELKGPIVFLASDASSFMTGANLIVDGGRTIW